MSVPVPPSATVQPPPEPAIDAAPPAADVAFAAATAPSDAAARQPPAHRALADDDWLAFATAPARDAHPSSMAERETTMAGALLDFNRRVLWQSLRDDVPLLERLRYLTIVSSNLDELFEVRAADLIDSVGDGDRRLVEGDASFAVRTHQLVEEQYAVLNDVLMPALAAHGVRILNHADRDAAQRRWVAEFFEQQVRPLLLPICLDPAHPFPIVANKSLNFIARLEGPDAFGRDGAIAIVKVPRALPRVIRLPASPQLLGPDGRPAQCFVLLTSVIRAHLAALFPGRQVVEFSQFRVTRDADLEVDEGDVQNLRAAMRSGLSTRNFGRALRLEVVHSCPPDLSAFLLRQLDLPQWALYRVRGPVNLARLTQLIDQVDPAPGDALHFAPFVPRWPAHRWPEGANAFEVLQAGDLLLHHPFDSFGPVVELLRCAVHDPQVLAIKQTIYRTGSDSELMELLLEAARRGKDVTVVVEIKARFDEEANINWAERLEAVGAQVVHGIVGLKTHGKLLVITRREHDRLRRYLHLSTGNYNARTARLYTDLGFMTADPAMAEEADSVFAQIASQSRLLPLRRLVPAPWMLHRRMLRHLRQVSDAAAAGRPARVVVKCNALTEQQLMAALVRAAAAGAKVDVIVRGACLLRPGTWPSGGSIRVRSVIGRFLEHTRIVYFGWGEGPAEEALYLSSADWMGRNMFRRIEVAWPIRDAAMRQRVIDEALVPYLHDGANAWTMRADGSYVPPAGDGPGAQQSLLALRGDVGA